MPPLSLALASAVALAPTLALTPFEAAQAGRLVQAYPAQLAGVRGDSLLWKDGTRQPLTRSPAPDYVGRLNTAGLLDQLDARYPACAAVAPPAWNSDPGRLRNGAFFGKLYGPSAAQVRANLEEVNWFGQRLQVTRVGGAAASLRVIARELAGHPELLPYAKPSAGTFSWRTIAGTERRSLHAYGAAIDLNTRFSAYWKWNGYREGQKGIAYRNRMPPALVRIFEAHGWIWGGRWYHYDTMHFEYRPELAGCR